ncbi:MAG: hypothetical protein HS108_08865 [Planctomycetes bacterium]|jgi:anti-sigma factor RsiW|nr:hypothetical protein [Planctomycetota bacterium]MCL4731250.1 hypothetical protein [Planctomycetota bacterium]
MTAPAPDNRLIDFALGELDPAAERALLAEMDRDPALRAQAERIRRNVLLVRAVPANDIAENALARLFAAVRQAATTPAHAGGHDSDGKVIPIGGRAWRYAWRAAAAALVAGTVIFGLSQMPQGPAPTVARVLDESGTGWVHDGDVVEAGIGSRRVVRFAAGEVLLDGASAVRLRRAGDFGPPGIEVLRGRAVISAGMAALSATVAENQIALEPGASVALNYELPYRHVSADGRVVEIQRQTVADVAALGEKTYGIRIDVSGLDPQIRQRRLSFFGNDMTPEAFVASMVEAASRFGVRDIPLNQRDVRLVYRGATDRSEGLDASVLQIALLAGNAVVSREGESLRLAEGTANSFEATSTRGTGTETRTGDNLARMVVWAGGLGNAAVDNRLRNVAARGGHLPQGTVIHTDRLVLRKAGPNEPERVFLLGGPEFTFPLPGDRKGRLVGLMSTGAEFEVQGETTREFIPLSSLGR